MFLFDKAPEYGLPLDKEPKKVPSVVKALEGVDAFEIVPNSDYSDQGSSLRSLFYFDTDPRTVYESYDLQSKNYYWKSSDSKYFKELFEVTHSRSSKEARYDSQASLQFDQLTKHLLTYVFSQCIEKYPDLSFELKPYKEFKDSEYGLAKTLTENIVCPYKWNNLKRGNRSLVIDFKYRNSKGSIILVEGNVDLKHVKSLSYDCSYKSIQGLPTVFREVRASIVLRNGRFSNIMGKDEAFEDLNLNELKDQLNDIFEDSLWRRSAIYSYSKLPVAKGMPDIIASTIKDYLIYAGNLNDFYVNSNFSAIGSSAGRFPEDSTLVSVSDKSSSEDKSRSLEALKFNRCTSCASIKSLNLIFSGDYDAKNIESRLNKLIIAPWHDYICKTNHDSVESIPPYTSEDL